MSFSLFSLVPAVYRLRDGRTAATMTLLTPAEQSELNALQTSVTPLAADQQAQLDILLAKSTRGPLESLLMVIDEQLRYFAADLDQLYDNQFIETCAPWVIPYIGDLIGYKSIKGIAPAVDNPRAEVANTISMRRRKGTSLVLEQLARDVTGWGAHAVEFWQMLAVTQYVKCPRPANHYAPNVRSWKPRAFRKSGFSRMARKVDVHDPSSPGLPPYNIPNLGIFLWSLQALGATACTPMQASTGAGPVPLCYRFNSLGYDMPLFHAAVYQGEQIGVSATQANVPDFLTRVELCDDLRRGAASRFYGQGASLALSLGGQLLNPYQIQVADLSGSDGSWNNVPGNNTLYAVAVDPELGRIALAPYVDDQAATLIVSYHYGFNAEMGGGEYSREAGFAVIADDAVFPYPDSASTPRYNTVQDAVNFVAAQTATLGKVALEFTSNAIIELPAAPLAIDVPDGMTMEIRARDGIRPTFSLGGEVRASGGKLSTLIIDGLLIAAAPGLSPGSPGADALVTLRPTRPDARPNELPMLRLLHTTLVPGWNLDSSGAPLQADALAILAQTPGGTIEVQSSILGPIAAPEFVCVKLIDSILDATDASRVAYTDVDRYSGGGPLTLTGCTVVGRVHAQSLDLVSNSIVWASFGPGWPSGLVGDRAQVGCIRFSFIPVDAIIPRKFKCVEQDLAGPAPVFISYHYGHPGYLKLLATTPSKVRNGADDGGEMGAFHFILAPLREQDLSIRLQEFTPVGLNTGLIYQT